MSEVLVGSAYSTMELRYQQFAQGASVVEQTIQRLLALSKTPITVQAQIGSGAGSGSGALTPPASRGGGAAPGVDADAAAYTRLQRAQASLEAQQARLARQQGDTAKAAQLEAQAQERLTTELNAQNGVTVQSIAIERQLASVQQQAERAAQQEAAAQRQAMDAMRASVAPVQQVGAATQNANSYVAAFKQGILGVVGPVAVVSTALAAAKGTVDSFAEAFKFKAQLDQTNASIGVSLQGVRDSGKAFDEAAAFANRYKLTQQETAQAIQASIPILRTSNSSLTDIESTLLRLQAKKPEKSIADAARALDELKAGQIVSIVDQFNVSRDAANKMKNEIAAGGDAVKILSQYLTTAGFGMEALETRTKGTAGALNDAAVAQERLTLAQGRLAEGPGVTITKLKTTGLDTLTAEFEGQGRALADANQLFASTLLKTGDFTAALDARAKLLNQTYLEQHAIVSQVTDAFDRHATVVKTDLDLQDRQAATINATIANNRAAAQAIHDQANEIIASTQKSVLDAAAKDTQQIATARLTAETNAATNAFLALNPGLDASGIAALVAAGKIDPLIGQLAALRVEAGTTGAALAQLAVQQAGVASLQKGLAGGAGSSVTTAFGAGAGSGVKAFASARADAEQLLDSQIQLAAAMGNTAKQIELLRQKERQYAATQAERNQIEAQIIGLQKSAGKTRVDAAQSTGLQLAQTEQNSQLAILKAQREGQERQRDQQQDYELNRSRKQEDYEEQRRKLLDSGQRKQADLLAQQFAKEQRRAAEDFNIARQRTNRNNAEATGDIGDRTDLRQSQIGDRAALRGGRPASSAPIDLGSAPPTLTGAGGRAQAPQPILLRVQIAPTQVQIDGHTIVDLTWPEFEQRIDAELADELGTIGIILPPGGGQTAVAGPRS